MIETYRKQINSRRAELTLARRQAREEKATLTKAEARQQALAEAQILVQQIAQTVQQEAHKQVAEVVTRSLAAIFDEPYEFKILFEQKRGRTEARMVFERDGLEIDPMTASGGGPIDVACMALRLSCLLLHRPPLRRLLILDEPFRFLSPDLRPRIRGLLDGLARETGVQIIMVTHANQLRTGKVIELS